MTRQPDDSCVRRLNAAFDTLATAKGDIKERLELYGLQIVKLQASDFDEKLRTDFNVIVSELSKFENPLGHSSIKYTMKKIKRSTAVHIVRLILDFQQKISIATNHDLIQDSND